jgi:hypothetical protein
MYDLDVQDQYELEVARQAFGFLDCLRAASKLQELWEPAALFDALFISNTVIQTVGKLFLIAQQTFD